MNKKNYLLLTAFLLLILVGLVVVPLKSLSTALIIGGMSPVATVAFMTGGGNPIMAVGLINNFTSMNLSWFLWLVLMLPLAWLLIFLCAFCLPVLFPGQERVDVVEPNVLPMGKKLTFQETAALGIVLMLIVLWISS